MAKEIKPSDLDFSYSEMMPFATGSAGVLVTAVFHGAFAVKNWLSCKFFFNSVKDHRNDDAWLKKTYGKLLEEYKSKDSFAITPKTYRYTELKWKIEAAYLMLKTPKKQRDKVDFEFVIDNKYDNGKTIFGQPKDPMYKIINKNAKKGVKNG